MTTHHHAEDIDWEAMSDQLVSQAELYVPAFEEAAAWLRGQVCEGQEATEVRRVLDVGSGPGVVTSLLARAFPAAEVVAVDQAEGLLERARAYAAEHGVAERVVTRRADLPGDIDALGEADLIWSRNTVHHLGDQQGALHSLGALLRPGGLLAVAEGGLPPRFLPRDIGLGRPGLQARLDVALEEVFTAMRADLPGTTSVVEDWPAMLAQSGLVPTGTRSFLVDIPAPLDVSARRYLHGHLVRLRDKVADRLPEEDLRTLDYLVKEDDERGVLWRPDVFYLAATTIHTARSCTGK
ncbi:MAG TPA: methyltransferase domain-containing protein [Thermomonospora sp.]|nr:methyltransferase domain-containing protein [Thermomonospora sp.]